MTTKENSFGNDRKSSEDISKKVENNSLLGNSIEVVKQKTDLTPSLKWKGSLYGHNESASISNVKQKQHIKVQKIKNAQIILLFS